MLTGKPITVASVEKELLELETMYRSKKKKLRALLAVLKEEAGKDGEKDGD